MILYSDLADLIRQIPERCKEKVIRELSTILHESQADDLLVKVEKQVIKKFDRSIHTLPINNKEYRTYIYGSQYDWQKENTGILIIPRHVGFFSAIAETLISLSELYDTELSKIIKEYTYMGDTCEDVTDPAYCAYTYFEDEGKEQKIWIYITSY